MVFGKIKKRVAEVRERKAIEKEAEAVEKESFSKVYRTERLRHAKLSGVKRAKQKAKGGGGFKLNIDFGGSLKKVAKNAAKIDWGLPSGDMGFFGTEKKRKRRKRR